MGIAVIKRDIAHPIGGKMTGQNTMARQRRQAGTAGVAAAALLCLGAICLLSDRRATTGSFRRQLQHQTTHQQKHHQHHPQSSDKQVTRQRRQASAKGDQRARQINREVNPFLSSTSNNVKNEMAVSGSPDEGRELGLGGIVVEDVDSRELEGNRELFLGRPVMTQEEINRELYMTWAADPEQNRKPRVLRDLSINLGNGQCMWTEPTDVPADEAYDIFQTVVIAYPGSGKRVAFMHMSGLTGLTTGDDYDFSGRSLHTGFMKSSYPHHEGIWSWGNRMDQSILVVRNPRWTLVGYHELLHEIQYAHTWTEAYANEDHVWSLRPTVAEWVAWRDQRFDDEIERWGWFIGKFNLACTCGLVPLR